MVRGLILSLVCISVMIPSVLFAQSYDSDTSDWQDWGRAAAYRAQVNALGDISIPVFPIPILLGVVPDALTSNFGDARDGGARFHEGLDIMAPEGTPVVTPTDAVVIRTGNGPNSGLYVRTANPGGEQFVYMHLKEIAHGIAAGSTVERGEVIGYVGSTGNAAGAGAHLHFEVRKDGAKDPLPRLTQTFTPVEQAAQLQSALERSGDTGLAQTLASAFPDELKALQDAGHVIPPAIAGALASAQVNDITESSGMPASPLGAHRIIFGEANSDVAALQRVLIAEPHGPSGVSLKNTGATGYFGPLTHASLIEYQNFYGLVPTGAIDDATYARLFAHDPSDAPVSLLPERRAVVFARDLEAGMVGEDVRALQEFLNTAGFVVADTGPGSPGFETDYFGERTRAALARYQTTHGIFPSVGYFGPKTRTFVLAD